MHNICSTAFSVAHTCNASWHIRSPRASPTSRIPISFALKMTPSPKKRPGSFRSENEKNDSNLIFAVTMNLRNCAKQNVVHNGIYLNVDVLSIKIRISNKKKSHTLYENKLYAEYLLLIVSC